MMINEDYIGTCIECCNANVELCTKTELCEDCHEDKECEE